MVSTTPSGNENKKKSWDGTNEYLWENKVTTYRDSPPPSSRQTGDRTRTLVSWSRRHIPTPPQSRTPLSTSDVLQVHGECTSSPLVQTLVKSRRTYRYWYSSPWNPDTLHGIGEGRENSGPHKSDLGRWGPSVWRYHLIDMYFSKNTWKW